MWFKKTIFYGERLEDGYADKRCNDVEFLIDISELFGFSFTPIQSYIFVITDFFRV
jgi:hypothetical protein